jgi:predicted PurR-regulated permease PerM
MPRPASVRIEIPRWVQLVALPLLLLLLWTVAGAVRHVLFLFLVALLIALLLNPLVRGLGRVWIPRGPAVALVYLAFAAAVALAVLALATVVVQETRSAAHRVDNYFTVESGHPIRTGAEQDLAKFQRFLDRHHLSSVHDQRQGEKFLNQVGTKDVQKYTSKALHWSEGAGVAVVTLLFDVFLVVVVSIYMLLDMQRLTDVIDRRFPPHGRGGLIVRMEQAVASYVKGQLLLSLIIGVSAGVGLWILGIVGLMPHGGRYAAAFGAWAGVTELIPYIGPWLGAAPPVLYALVQHPLSRYPAVGGTRGRPERDGALAAASPATRHLRPARRRGDLRFPRDPGGAAVARGGPGGMGVLRRTDRACSLGCCPSPRGDRGRHKAGPAARHAARAGRLSRLRRTLSG